MRGNDGEAGGVDGPEEAFLRYWAQELLDPGDPQRERWATLERAQIDRNEGIAAEVHRFVSLRGRRALDVGCQTGALAIAMSRRGADVTAVDVDEKLIEGARIRARGHGSPAHFAVAVAEALPFPDRSFDVVTFVDVIEHVADARAAVREIARVLRPGGTLYLFGPNRLSPSLALSDPHYQLAAVSVMPRWMGEWYVTRVRGFPRYEVGVLPVGGVVERWLAEDGLAVIDSARDDATRWWSERAPARFAGLHRAARLWGAARVSVAPLFRLVARRA
jgi:SAM-dependent methyltransferase